MDLIIILILAILLFTFIAIMRKPQKAFVDRFMEKGLGVQPLFKEKSAQIKYANLCDALKQEKTELSKLETLKKTYDDGVINVDAYNMMLDNLYQQYIKH